MTAETIQPAPRPPGLRDGFGRGISYLRLSVTDRCDLRCRYCMAETMAFAPRDDVLSIAELTTLAERFVARGVRKIRLTGGEPLVRGGIGDLVRAIGRQLGDGLDELTLTTNGNHLARHAAMLVEAGVRRVNVSLDTRDPARFREITRWGALDRTLGGIAAARSAGLHVKINMVALKGLNEDEIADMLRWCGAEGHDLTLIETMPLGTVDEDRADRFLPLDTVRERLAETFTLVPIADRTGGPARYWHVAETGGRLGLITPLSANFCDGCNRVRVTAEGQLYLCLGHDERADLRAVLRSGGGSDALDAAIDGALRIKPLRHAFRIERGAAPALTRHMSATGG